ncbi:hypothetical protein VTK26DRAFT_7453 [Humicola hyalothermophila]
MLLIQISMHPWKRSSHKRRSSWDSSELLADDSSKLNSTQQRTLSDTCFESGPVPARPNERNWERAYQLIPCCVIPISHHQPAFGYSHAPPMTSKAPNVIRVSTFAWPSIARYRPINHGPQHLKTTSRSSLH